jgi:hypothetical protein
MGGEQGMYLHVWQPPRDRFPLDLDLTFFEAECSTEVIIDSLSPAQLCDALMLVLQ